MAVPDPVVAGMVAGAVFAFSILVMGLGVVLWIHVRAVRRWRRWRL